MSLLSLPPRFRLLPASPARPSRPQGKGRPVLLRNSHLRMEHGFLPRQRRMPYIPARPAPARGRPSHDGREPGTADSQPRGRPTRSGVSHLSLLFPLQGVGGGVRACTCVVESVCAYTCVVECACEGARQCAAVCMCTLGQNGKCQVLIFLFHHSFVNSSLSAASKPKGKTRPTRFLIYHLAQSSMFRKRSSSQMSHDHVFKMLGSKLYYLLFRWVGGQGDMDHFSLPVQTNFLEHALC